ncbi:MAG: NAD(P)H-dependent oxidoreductase [Sphaerochaetaceae bacterium]
MSIPKIAIIISSTRTSRVGEQVASWISQIGAKRTDIQLETVDLRDYPMPFFDELASNAYVPSQNEVARRWQKKIAEFDGYVFVTAEYNNSITGVLKNALDYAYPEWNRKAAAYVGYGSVGGARAVQHLKDISVELQMAPVRHAVHIQGSEFFPIMNGQKKVSELTHLVPNVEALFEQLAWWAKALKSAREA